jgi:predicted anti-sigma-YlaC factor YlaD
MGDDVACRELVELVTDYLEGRLSAREYHRLDAHLALCEGCRAYLEQMRQTIRTLGRLTEDAVQPEARARLLDVFRAWKRGRT